jgi:hypothetical protein
MALVIKIDAAGIAAQFKDLAREVEADLKKGVERLAVATHAKVGQMANAELNSSRKSSRGQTEQKIFNDSLKFETVAPGVHVVGLADEALWIEEGIKPGTDMKPGLLASDKAVTHKSGVKTLTIPFQHSATKAQTEHMTDRAKNIISELRENLRREKVNYRKIERNEDGSPKLGRLQSFNFPSAIPGKGNTPALHGVSIYQSVKNGNVRRDILTFRTVSSGSASQGKWIHPGKEGPKFFDRAFDWAKNEWETKILPEILDKWK